MCQNRRFWGEDALPKTFSWRRELKKVSCFNQEPLKISQTARQRLPCFTSACFSSPVSWVLRFFPHVSAWQTRVSQLPSLPSSFLSVTFLPPVSLIMTLISHLIFSKFNWLTWSKQLLGFFSLLWMPSRLFWSQCLVRNWLVSQVTVLNHEVTFSANLKIVSRHFWKPVYQEKQFDNLNESQWGQHIANLSKKFMCEAGGVKTPQTCSPASPTLSGLTAKHSAPHSHLHSTPSSNTGSWDSANDSSPYCRRSNKPALLIQPTCGLVWSW